MDYTNYRTMKQEMNAYAQVDEVSKWIAQNLKSKPFRSRVEGCLTGGRLDVEQLASCTRKTQSTGCKSLPYVCWRNQCVNGSKLRDYPKESRQRLPAGYRVGASVKLEWVAKASGRGNRSFKLYVPSSTPGLSGTSAASRRPPAINGCMLQT